MYDKKQEAKNDKAMELIQNMAKEYATGREVDGIIYRSDYQDYRFLFVDKTHCEIREKLIDILLTGVGAKDELIDARNEVIFHIKHAVEFEEWEDDGKDPGQAKAPPDLDI